jgi:hypothetical protein
MKVHRNCCGLDAHNCYGQEKPFFVTYSADLEEPGNLEISSKAVQAAPQYGNPFFSETIEFEYGLKAWWTTEVYFSGQHTYNDSTIFGGWRWENRFKPLPRQHFVNPILYPAAPTSFPRRPMPRSLSPSLPTAASRSLRRHRFSSATPHPRAR